MLTRFRPRALRIWKAAEPLLYAILLAAGVMQAIHNLEVWFGG